LAYIAEFTSNVRHISREDNIVADMLSWQLVTAQGPAAAETVVAASRAVLDYTTIAARQAGCTQSQHAASSSALRAKLVV
jgi:hypothetical protein